MKNAHLRRSLHPLSLRRTPQYASLLRISGALHLGIFDQPERNEFSNRLLNFHYIFRSYTCQPVVELRGAIAGFHKMCYFECRKFPVEPG